jgi:site-specific DNA recombinase
MSNSNGASVKTVRCAVYTRKSTEEGLEQDFNSLDAQREGAEAYIASQRHEGWVLVAEHFDDAGFSGASRERPALQRLLGAVRAGEVNCVVVYKVDRLSRSLLDFVQIMAVFEQHGASFVSVTQQFHTTTSLGRLTLNILLSFAQFERELIGERTRDKMWAAKKKGKWVGGFPPLGYDVAPQGGRLVVNQAEAERVRWIFQTTAELGGLAPALEALRGRGWTTKSWTTREGVFRAGVPFTLDALSRLLRNPVYRGAVNWHGELQSGEQEAIVDSTLWQQVNALKGPRTVGRQGRRQRSDALLRGLLYCEPCQSPMVPSSTRKNNRQYRYYICLKAQKQGWALCPSKSLPAHRVEEAVWQQIRERGLAAAEEGGRQALEEIVEHIGFDGSSGRMTIRLRPVGAVGSEVSK